MDETYPVRVHGELDESMSRWMWLVKWLLIVPHAFVLIFLWLAFWVLSIVAFFAILVTGRYPKAIFEFNVGVMRWSWRVGYYAYGVLGTDRYPPFSLDAEPGYPATLDIEYPERLSRGLVLVKWWLLAIPHYILLALVFGGATWFTWSFGDNGWAVGGSLLGLLVLIAVLMFAFSGRYPRPLFDVIVGIHRWALRVGAYAALMTDKYPPFRLDMGPDEPRSPTPTTTTGPSVAA